MNGWGWAMMVVWTAVWLGVLAVVLWTVIEWNRRGDRRDGDRHDQAPMSPRELLDQRFARGEVDLAEYQARRGALER
jgi:putative membrane protein